MEEYLIEEALRNGYLLTEGFYISEVFNSDRVEVDDSGEVIVTTQQGVERVQMRSDDINDEMAAAALRRAKKGTPRFWGTLQSGGIITLNNAAEFAILRRAGKSGKRIEITSGKLQGNVADLVPLKNTWGGKREGAGRDIGSTSERAAAASRKNGRLGGRPRHNAR